MSVVDELRGLLKRQGLRATSARLGVLSVLHDARAPLTHEEVMEALPTGQFDRASVWRLLSDLSDAELLRRMDLGDRVWRFELLDACRDVADDHPHFLCDDCGEVQCLPSLRLAPVEGTLPAFLAHADVRIRVTGSCGACRQPSAGTA